MSKRLRFLFALLACLIAIAVGRMVTAPRFGPGHAVYLKGIAAAESGDSALAVHNLRRAVMAEPGNGDYHAELGNLQLKANRPDLALVELQEAAFLSPDRPHLFCQLAQTMVDLRRRKEAVEALEEALRRTPDCAHALGVKAEQDLRDDNLKGALETYRRLVAVAPGLTMAHQKVGYLLLAVDQVDEAIRFLEKAAAQFPSDPALNALLGDAYSRRKGSDGSTDEAIRYLKRAAAANPGAPDAHVALGKLYLRKGDLPAARKEYEAALASHPGHMMAQYGLSQVASREGKPAESAALLRAYQATQLLSRQITEMQAQADARPGDLEPQLRIAKLCLQHGLTDRAARALETAVQADPSRREARELRARLYRSVGRQSLAAQEEAVASALK
jgi:tetratricopeptide (TPR) repeat protein